MKFKLIEKLNEWIDQETGKEYYNYHTGIIKNPPNDIFDLTKTGMSFYDLLIPGNKENLYMKDYKNLKGEIEYITPRDYYKECANNIFTSKDVTENHLLQTRQVDKETLDTIKEVIVKYSRQLPLCFLDYAYNTQEGLHRMLAVADLYGWDCKVPVLIVNWNDPEYEEKRRLRERIELITGRINGAINQCLRYTYNDISELEDELLYHLLDNFEYYEPEWLDTYAFKITGTTAIVEVLGIKQTFSIEGLID